MAITDTLAAIPLFAGLRQPELEALAQRMRPRRYKENEALFHRDDPGAAMYIILSGRVKIHNEGADGTDIIIVVFKSGDFFGELSLLDGSERSADATTMEPTELLMLTRGDLEATIERNPQIALEHDGQSRHAHPDLQRVNRVLVGAGRQGTRGAEAARALRAAW